MAIPGAIARPWEAQSGGGPVGGGCDHVRARTAYLHRRVSFEGIQRPSLTGSIRGRKFELQAVMFFY